MNRHQVLTGAANNHDYSTSIGSVENKYFTVSLLFFHSIEKWLNN